MTIEKKKYNSCKFYFLFFYMATITVICGCSYLFYRISNHEFLLKLEVNESAKIKNAIASFDNVVDSVTSDLFILEGLTSLEQILPSNSEEARKHIESGFFLVGRGKKRYDQIRILNITGQEIIRFNYMDGHPEIVPPQNLQSKGDRYYFKKSILLPPKKIYVSPMDLNVEHGDIEKPFKPVMRFCTPTFDEKGNKQGVVILNFLGDYLFQKIEAIGKRSGGNIMIVNADGYWLLNTADPGDCWGFMLKTRTHVTFPGRYPDLWDRITSEENVQEIYKGDLFTSAPVFFPRNGKPDGIAGEKMQADWYIISRVPAEKISGSLFKLKDVLILVSLILSVFSFFPVYKFAQLFAARKQAQRELYISAHYDSLTGLINRGLFYHSLDQQILHAERYQEIFGLLFIDIDGFKKVNDTMGHDTGDLLLIAIAERLKSSVRKSDVVARLGGDEFVIIVKSLPDAEQAGAIAEKIIQTVAEDYSLGTKTAKIGASIGISMYPINGLTADILVKKADTAMYECKQKGKNQYCFNTSDNIHRLG